MATPVYANSSNQLAALKELYIDSSDYLKDEVYKENPFLALVPKLETIDGAAGKYIPVPIVNAAPQGRVHAFGNAQNQQTPSVVQSFFVYVVSDYQIVTITNLLMEQTKTSAGAFIDEAKLQLDGGFRTLTNNIAFELFADGTCRRGVIGSGSLVSGTTYSIALADPQSVVQFEVNMLLVNFTFSATSISGLSSTQALVTKVDRAAGIITVLASGADASWTTAGLGLGIYGDVQAGAIQFGAVSSQQGICGLSAWLPMVAPTTGDSFWGVDRSQDPTRLAGIRYDASSMTIEEGLTNALALLNREGGKPDIAIMDFASYSALVNSLGAKVQYVQAKHDEVEVAFEGITFQSAYGRVTVLADRSCPSQTCFLLTMSTFKLRSLGKVPHILTYGMEGLEGLRVGNADALEIRIAHYSNLICSAPGWNAIVRLSS